ncbi:oligosaccharide flippase family protein [Flavobacterium azooxidireducens]|uniref:Oligosaccharide flippase family protein n=1 Tax=Flavobacterium azooxidireducens TaxID=1871076 RepID=A0ABY4KI78_9FLAO|nr:oligosaccharide flippase family protein [Flavobacterium azooxidireducens]UPQ80529.1 oligosaccharide flippase family protein [Flavobacterium azooxidireducens]
MKIIQTIKNNKQFQHFSIYGIGQFFNLILPFIAIPYIISICGEENFGKIGVGLGIAFFLLVFIDYGTDILGVKYIAINRDDKKLIGDYYRIVFLSKIFLTLIVIFLSTLSYFFIPYFKENQNTLLLGFTILISQLLNPIWVFQGLEKYNWITLINVSSKALYLVFIFLFIKQAEDYVFVNFFFGLGLIIPNTIGSVKIIRYFKVNLLDFSKNDIKSYLKEDFSFCFSQLFIALKNYSPIIVIGYFSGFKVAGYYKIIEQIIMPIRTYLQVYFRFFYPKLSYKLALNSNQGMSFWKKINLYNFILIIFLIISIYIFSQEILKIFKVDDSVIRELSDTLNFFLIYPLIFTITFALEMLYFIIGKRTNYVRYVIYTVMLNILLMCLLTPKLEIVGVIVSLIVSELILIVLYLTSLKKVR